MDRWGFSLLKILTFQIEGLWRNPGGKMNSNLFFIHSPIYPNKLCRNTDGLEILDCHLFYRPLTKEKDGLQ